MQIPLLIQFTLALALLASAAPVLDSDTGGNGLCSVHAPRKATASDGKINPVLRPNPPPLATKPAPTPETNQIKVRTGLSHPHPTGTFSLFHGAESVAELVPPDRVDLRKTQPRGDFHHVPEVPYSGFYMTDSLVAAAKFACFGEDEGPDTVEVVEFQWTGTDISTYVFPEEVTEWQQFVRYNMETPEGEEATRDPFHAQALAILQHKVMIAGPMNTEDDMDLTSSFWQYALIDQMTANSNRLEYKAQYSNIFCNSMGLGVGTALMDTVYAEGQGGNPDFASRLAQLQVLNQDCLYDFVPLQPDTGDPYDSYMPTAVSQSQGAGKKLVVEEWGSLVGSGRTANLNSNVCTTPTPTPTPRLGYPINPFPCFAPPTGAEDQRLQGPMAVRGLPANPDPHHSEDYEVRWAAVLDDVFIHSAQIQVSGAGWSARDDDFSASPVSWIPPMYMHYIYTTAPGPSRIPTAELTVAAFSRSI
ncbi:hypothetical protein B0H10DRAFT_2224810 [Mycena sp. CBHHK59/15]|nr:hypothetical protein B0H10DRAFT_2224810 [Mycena sp. CBHHK59/15]